MFSNIFIEKYLENRFSNILIIATVVLDHLFGKDIPKMPYVFAFIYKYIYQIICVLPEKCICVLPERMYVYFQRNVYVLSEKFICIKCIEWTFNSFNSFNENG